MPTTQKRPLIAFLITGDILHNSRGIRQIHALLEHGFRVKTFSMTDAVESRREPPSETAWLSAPNQSGPRFFWAWHRRISKAALESPADIFHASDLYTLAAAVKASRRHRAKCTYDARELYANVVSTVNRPYVSWFWRLIERSYIRQCEATFTVSNSIADLIALRYAVPTPTVVENVPPYRTRADNAGKTGLRRRLNLSKSEVLIIHQGQMRPYRGCEVLVRAVPMLDKRAHVAFLGSGPLAPELKVLAASLGCSNRVHFIDPVPPDQLLDITAETDIGVTLLEDVCLNHHYALPNKLFEYLAAGIPVLGSNLPEIAKVIHQFNVGLVCNPGDSADTASKLNQMVINKDARVRWSTNTSTVFETINWESASQRMLERFRKALEA
ncbi:MAG: glycosyltransferase [Rhodothermia bacterium]|nr:glycosyltransferase [Rhodothermia bacterium]